MYTRNQLIIISLIIALCLVSGWAGADELVDHKLPLTKEESLEKSGSWSWANESIAERQDAIIRYLKAKEKKDEEKDTISDTKKDTNSGDF